MTYRTNEQGHYVSCDYCGAETAPRKGVPFVAVSDAQEQGWNWGTGHEPETYHICRECQGNADKWAAFCDRKNKSYAKQSQDSLDSQLRKLISLADRLGLYDAADYLRKAVER